MSYLENLNAGFDSFDKAISTRTSIMNELQNFSEALSEFTNSKFGIKLGVRIEKHFDKRYKGISRVAAIASSLLEDETLKYEKTYLALYCDSVTESELLSEISISEEGFPVVLAGFGIQSIVLDLDDLKNRLSLFSTQFDFINSIKVLAEKAALAQSRQSN